MATGKHRRQSCRTGHIALTMAVWTTALLTAACSQDATWRKDTVYAPGVDRSVQVTDQVTVGHRLISAGEYELALRAFARATLDREETDAEILLGLGTANLGLGRLGQAERQFRLAIEQQGEWPELYNNLGVVLMEQGRMTEAVSVFRTAYALDNGSSDEIRDNLRLSLEKTAGSDTVSEEANDYKLVRRGSGSYVIRRVP